MDRYFNARHRSSNSVSVRKTLDGCPAFKISALALWTQTSSNLRLAVPNFD
ncbi:hypothetical protein DPMN_031893 [Dreissena polymorpha]|uniref:Uncharacterized protein n=1 Tax=Dreissena polymorpha TaxID=45954 RepID=A0A9D4RHH0_DREPO|nr:hypothetical protein DPMN_031893 [Dreissena polymorpha]